MRLKECKMTSKRTFANSTCPEVSLWRYVLIQAGKDAISNNEECHEGVEKIYRWSKGAECKEVCSYADVDYDCVRNSFESIYIQWTLNKKKKNKRENKKQSSFYTVVDNFKN